jgi:hypothetical protein
MAVESDSTRLFIDDLLHENFTLQRDRSFLMRELVATKELLSVALSQLAAQYFETKVWAPPSVPADVDVVEMPTGMVTWREIPWEND